MIGGCDISFPVGTASSAMEAVIRSLLVHWKRAIVENAQTGKTIVLPLPVEESFPREVFVYKDVESCKLWERLGAVEKTADTMVHVLQGTESITVVVDDPQSVAMAHMLRDIHQLLGQDIFWIRAVAA